MVETKMVEGLMLFEACAMSQRALNLRPMLFEACAMSQQYELSPSALKDDIQRLSGVKSGGLLAYSMRE